MSFNECGLLLKKPFFGEECSRGRHANEEIEAGKEKNCSSESRDRLRGPGEDHVKYALQL